MNVRKTEFQEKRDSKGALTFLESERDIPFPVRRVYYIYDVEQGERRGLHAHRALRQYLICAKGSCEVLLDNSIEKATVRLDKQNEGLYVGPMIWHEMYNFSPDALLIALASDYYDESDYIRDYDTFLNLCKKG